MIKGFVKFLWVLYVPAAFLWILVLGAVALYGEKMDKDALMIIFIPPGVLGVALWLMTAAADEIDKW